VPASFSANRLLHALLLLYGLTWTATAIAPRDSPTWALENLLALLFVGLLVVTYRRFSFSNLSYLLIAVFLSLHAVGAHTGYANAPIGDWLKNAFGLSRNPYDRVAHFAFGFLLAYPVRELLVRIAGVRGPIRNWLALSLIVAASTCFEIIEAAVAEIVSPGTGPSWLGAQGDEWDTQLDMGSSLFGAALAMLITTMVERICRPNLKPGESR
jgi:putative membrane protein